MCLCGEGGGGLSPPPTSNVLLYKFHSNINHLNIYNYGNKCKESGERELSG